MHTSGVRRDIVVVNIQSTESKGDTQEGGFPLQGEERGAQGKQIITPVGEVPSSEDRSLYPCHTRGNSV